MKKINHIFAAIVGATGLLLGSCNDFLDIQPKGELIPETTEDFESMLNYAQLVKGGDTYPTYLTDDVFLPNESDGISPALNTVAKSVINLYTFKSVIFSDSEEDKFWTNTYARIFYFNSVIDRVLDSTVGTEAQKRSIRAEALLGRAFEYLTLVNLYAKHYDAQTASTDPGVPLVLEAEIDRGNLKRASVQEVYDQVRTDLEEAIQHLPETPKYNACRGSIYAGLGLLARMYLYMGDYTQALSYANRSLEKNSSLLDLKNYRVVKPEAAIGRNNVPDLDKNPENIYIRMAPYVYGMSRTACVSEDLLALYDKTNDQRALIFITNTPFGVSVSNYVWMQYIRTNLGIATPEIYLIAAECEARVGSKTRAMELVNTLRDNRILNHTALVPASDDDVLRIVLEERRRELPMIGILRVPDLKRLNTDARFAKTITHISGTDTLTLVPGDKKYILPIPSVVMRFNPGTMVQNER